MASIGVVKVNLCVGQVDESHAFIACHRTVRHYNAVDAADHQCLAAFCDIVGKSAPLESRKPSGAASAIICVVGRKRAFRSRAVGAEHAPLEPVRAFVRPVSSKHAGIGRRTVVDECRIRTASHAHRPKGASARSRVVGECTTFDDAPDVDRRQRVRTCQVDRPSVPIGRT